MRQEDLAVVGARQAAEVVARQLAQLLAIHVHQFGGVDVVKTVLLHGPRQPGTHVLGAPQDRVCKGGGERTGETCSKD